MTILSFHAASPTALPCHKTSFHQNFTAVNFTAVAKLEKRTEFAREYCFKEVYILHGYPLIFIEVTATFYHLKK